MSKDLYLAQLKQLLGELPATERDEALEYYENYFADAGEENEQAVINELGSPENLAFSIKAGYADPDGEAGEFTERGFTTGTTTKEEIINTYTNSEDRGFSKPRNNTNIWLIIIICILLSPVIIPAAATLFGIAVAVLATIFGIMVAIFATGIGMIVAGVIVGITGVGGLPISTMGGTLMLGAAVGLVGFGMLATQLGVMIIRFLFPRFIRVIVTLFTKLVNVFTRRKEVV